MTVNLVNSSISQLAAAERRIAGRASVEAAARRMGHLKINGVPLAAAHLHPDPGPPRGAPLDLSPERRERLRALAVRVLLGVSLLRGPGSALD